MSRKSARENVFKLVYQMSFRDTAELKGVIEYFFSENPVNSKDEAYINQITEGVFGDLKSVDDLINTHLKKWDNERIGKIDLAIMRVSVFEMLKMEDIPPGVSINEAVELAKKYGSDESPAFINGVLGAVEKELKSRGE